jgi:hypothetical protein
MVPAKAKRKWLANSDRYFGEGEQLTAKQWGDLAYIVVALGLVLLSIGFLAFTKWWHEGVGRSLAAFFIVILVIMGWGLSIVIGWIPVNAGTYIARAWLYGLLGVTVWVMFGGFVKVQFFPRKKKREPHDRDHYPR